MQKSLGRILITGATGLFSPYAIEAARSWGEVVSTSRSGGDVQCELSDLEQVKKLIGEVRPDVVIHGAAMTDVDGCERDPVTATVANEQATANIIDCLAPGAQLVYLSTDQVYPDTTGPHVEGEEAPVNAYGRSKLAGENSVLKWDGGIVARTSFFGPSRTPGRSSLSDFISDNLANGKPISLFTDILFSPLHARTLAKVLIEMVANNLSGVFNVASRSGMTKADFGLKVADHLGLQTKLATLSKAAAMPGRAPRISDLRLNPEKLERALGSAMPNLVDEIAQL
jgi:dTDP-4-dehydrorhamnose reductase